VIRSALVVGDEDGFEEGHFVPHVSFRQAPGSNRYVALCRHCGAQDEAPHQMDILARVDRMTSFLDDHKPCRPEALANPRANSLI